jgi:hypothetical protein
VNPPPPRASFAINEAPATTEGSSRVIGTSTSRPFTWKFNAIIYQANAQSIKTQDEVMQTLVNLR